jgi:hypothetical protein
VTSLSPTMRHLLVTLADSMEPLSGRQLAGLTGLSPTTANNGVVGEQVAVDLLADHVRALGPQHRAGTAGRS